MGPMWFDGLPLFSVLCSLFMGLIVRGSSSSEFHSFNRTFLSLSLSLSLSIHSGDRYLLVGSNGAGFSYNVRDALRAFTMGHGYAKCPQNLALSNTWTQQLECQKWESVNFLGIVLQYHLTCKMAL